MRFPDPVSHIRSHLSEDRLQLMRTTALSAAGFSAGLIVLLAQVKGQPVYSQVSLWAAVFSFVVWLFGAQYISTYLVHGESTYKYINIFLSALVAILGYAALFTAVVATVWQLSICAGIVLLVLGVVLAVAVFVHARAVDRLCNEADA